MRLLSLLFLILTGCTNHQGFNTNSHFNEEWGISTRHTLISNKDYSIQARLKRISTKFKGDYRTDKETWEILAISNSQELVCISPKLLIHNFLPETQERKSRSFVNNSTSIQIDLTPNSIYPLWIITQTPDFEDILKFEYYSRSTAIIKIEECK